MSGRKKRLREQVIDRMFSKAISVREARVLWARIETGGEDEALEKVDRLLKQSQRLAAKGKKKALEAERLMAPEVAKARRGLAGQVAGYEQYFDSSDPETRERARAAAEQELVTKGLRPGTAAGRQPEGTVRAMVQVPGPDGRLGWQPVRVAPPAGPPAVPPGIAGR